MTFNGHQANENKEKMDIVIVGHVDHGKSTVIGRLLADTDSLPQGKLAAVQEKCRRQSKPFEYAFLLDALKDEQEQGITIDSARCFFKSAAREYIIIDAPGHIEFLRNMVTGASRANAALLVIDAKEGIQENSKRHGYLLSMLGIKKIVVLVNKMDLVSYDEGVFYEIVSQYSEFLKEIGIQPLNFIPISALGGINLTQSATETPWYSGPHVLEQLDSLENEASSENQAFRMPVQGVYKFTRGGDDRRIVAGSIETGRIQNGDEVVFYPSGKRARIKRIEVMNSPDGLTTAGAGEATGFTLDQQIYIRRGELATLASETPPQISHFIRANVFWLGKQPLVSGKRYQLKIGSATTHAYVRAFEKVLDASQLAAHAKTQIDGNEVGEVIIETDQAIAFDLTHQLAKTSRFVLVDGYEIAGGGIVIAALNDLSHAEDSLDGMEGVQQSVQSLNRFVQRRVDRNSHWERGNIGREERAVRYSQKPTLVLIFNRDQTSEPSERRSTLLREKKALAKAAEENLFKIGRMAYYLGIGSVKHSLEGNPWELLGQVGHFFLDAGHILIATASDVAGHQLQALKALLDDHDILFVEVGQDKIPIPVQQGSVGQHRADLVLSDDHLIRPETGSLAIQRLLEDKGRIYKW